MKQAESQELLSDTPKSFTAPVSAFAVASPSKDDVRTTVWKLYCSHALSMWGERMWEFASGLVMFYISSYDMQAYYVLLRLQENSLFLVSTQGLVSGIAVVLMGGLIGSLVDRSDRLRVACNMYMLQNLSLAISGGCALAAFLVNNTTATFILIVFIIASTAVSSVASSGSTLSVEKEWTKQMCELDSSWLAQTNAGMRRIDLCCLILSPILVGFLMTYVSVPAAIGFIVAWNCLAWAPECLLLRSAYRCCDILREPKRVEDSGQLQASQGVRVFVRNLVTYLEQETAFAALSLAILYLTVLSFGILMTAYLSWNGMSEAELSLYRGCGALSGIAATLIFPPLQKHIGLDISAGMGIWFQFCSLLLAALPAFLTGVIKISSIATARILVWGLVSSRLGLWLFDLSVSQMLQDRIDEQSLGAINGIQGSLCSVFSTISFAAGMAVWDPTQFRYLMLGSVGIVLTAALLFTLPHLILMVHWQKHDLQPRSP